MLEGQLTAPIGQSVRPLSDHATRGSIRHGRRVDAHKGCLVREKRSSRVSDLPIARDGP